MSFRDFLANLQSGLYSRPASKNETQSFCEQIMFTEEDAATLETIEQFDAAAGKLKTIRIRQVTGGGSFSSGTKAKFKLSIPISVTYVEKLTSSPRTQQFWTPAKGWQTYEIPGSLTPSLATIPVSMMTLYHPSPLRIENIQHDAVLSLNDPSDPTATAVILIPLKSSNTTDPSVGFFSRIAYYLTQIQTADPVTGLYPEITVPTGNGWGINRLFWLGPAGTDKMSLITDSFFTWTGMGSYKRVPVELTATYIRMGWEPEGNVVRYFMLERPVSISSSDLSLLTRHIPRTPPEQAIHTIPDPSISGNSKVLYKTATGDAAVAACSAGRECMTNPTLGAGAVDMLKMKGGCGLPGADRDSCDPFNLNIESASVSSSLFTPTKIFAAFFNVLLLVAIAFGSWLAMFLVTNKDYDTKLKEFANDAGQVAGTLLLQTSGRIKDVAYGAAQSGPGQTLQSVGGLDRGPKV
jgi:hypothetical protein